MVGTFIIIVLGICLGLTQVCRLSTAKFFAENYDLVFFPEDILKLDNPVAYKGLIFVISLVMAIPFLFYTDPIAAFTGSQVQTETGNGFLPLRLFWFIFFVILSDLLSKTLRNISQDVMSTLFPNVKFQAYPKDRESMRKKHKRYGSYEDFSERLRRAAWESSSYGRHYTNYEDYSKNHSSYRTQERTRSYKKAKTQSVPHTPRLAALRELGLSGSPSQKAIKSAYRKLARKHHPDNFMTKGDAAVEAAETRMKALNAAYDYLSGS